MKTPEDEAWEEMERRQGGGFPAKRAMAAAKLQEPVLAPAPGYCKNCKDYTIEAPLYAQPAQEPVSLRRGDILRCMESNVLCTVWATSTTGKTLVKWGSNDFGSYTAEQIGELFWLEPAQEPVTTVTSESGNPDVTMSWWHEPPLPVGTPLYTYPPQRTWVGLTAEETSGFTQHEITVVKYVSKVLQEKNT
jgi:hypothetical protein